MSRVGAEREGERIPSRLHTVSLEPDAGLKHINCEIVTPAEIKSWTPNRLTHPGTLLFTFLTFILFVVSRVLITFSGRNRDRMCAHLPRGGSPCPAVFLVMFSYFFHSCICTNVNNPGHVRCCAKG